MDAQLLQRAEDPGTMENPPNSIQRFIGLALVLLCATAIACAWLTRGPRYTLTPIDSVPMVMRLDTRTGQIVIIRAGGQVQHVDIDFDPIVQGLAKPAL